MPEAKVTLVNPLGLHARAAAKLVKLAACYESSITISRPNKQKSADARSILGILELGAKHGTELIVSANGVDASKAVIAATQLIESGFGEL